MNTAIATNIPGSGSSNQEKQKEQSEYKQFIQLFQVFIPTFIQRVPFKEGQVFPSNHLEFLISGI